MKIALIGNTNQTKIGLERLVKEGYEVTHIFGLPEDKAVNKVNFVPLSDFCLEHSIVLDTSNRWDNLLDIDSDQLELKDIDAEIAKELEKDKKDQAPGKPKSSQVSTLEQSLIAGIKNTEAQIEAIKTKALNDSANFGPLDEADMNELKALEKILSLKKQALAGI